MLTSYVLLAVIALGIALSLFQFVYTWVTYRANEASDAEVLIELKALYKRSRAAAPVARVLQRRRAAEKPMPKNTPH